MPEIKICDVERLLDNLSRPSVEESFADKVLSKILQQSSARQKRFSGCVIYYVPKADSQERFAVLFAMINEPEDQELSEVKVVSPLPDNIYSALFGDKAREVRWFIDETARSLSAYLQEYHSFDCWWPPVRGILQDAVRIYTGKHQDDALRQMIMNHSSMATGHPEQWRVYP